MQRFNLAENLTIPRDAVTETFAFLAMRGAGKTYGASVLLECLLSHGDPVVAVDTVGVMWGIKSDASGKKPGFPVVIFGGDHADIPLDAGAGEMIASAIVQGRFPAIVDLSALRKGESMRFVAAFAETLYRLNREPLHVCIDEADTFAPQQVRGDDARCCGAIEDLVKKGRARGLGCTLITQRPQVLNKSVLTQCSSLIAMRMSHNLDIKAVGEWVGVHATEEEFRDVKKALPTLKTGEAWFWSPHWLGALKRIHIAKRMTFDSSATPKAGEKRQIPKTVAEIDVGKLTADIQSMVEKAKADDPKALKVEIAKLKAELAKKPAASKAETKIVEKPVLKDAQVKRLESLGNTVLAQAAKLQAKIDEFTTAAREISHLAIFKAPVAPQKTFTQKVNLNPLPRREIVYPKGKENRGDAGLNKAQQRIIDAMAWYESLGNARPTLTQLGAVALIDPTGGYFSNTVGPLVTNGLVLRGSGTIELTAEGRAAANALEDVGTLADYHEVLKRRISKMKSANGKTIAILEAVIDAGGELTVEQIGELVGIDHTGGYFSNSIGPLSTAGVITRSGGVVRPTDVLFPEGLA